MVEEADAHAAATEALKGLVKSIAHTSARATHDLKVEFDVEDPRVARWLILATFEAMFTPSAASTQAELLRRAAEGAEPVIGKARRRKSGQRLVTWEDLIDSAANGAE